VKRHPLITFILFTCFTLALTSLVSAAQEDNFAKATGKKLIEYGWDRPSPEYTRDNIRQMEKAPFEGVIMQLPDNGGNVFTVKGWSDDEQQLQGQLKVLSSIQWGKFTDNFIAMYAASDMDWYSDADWETVLAKVKFCAKAAKAAGCVGLMLDTEPYGINPWDYSRQKHAKEYSYTQYAEKIRQRGQQFMEAMQSEMPSLKVLSLHEYSLLYSYSQDPANGSDATKRAAAFQGMSYGLMLPFLNGMIEAANPGTQLIDGNESSYYYETPAEFTDAYKVMRHGAKVNVPDSLKAKFDEHHRAGNALYPDHLYGLRPERKYISSYMTPQQQNKWFEQNVYYSLKTSDEYVWLYGQHMNWWTGKGLPAGIIEAITSAKSKLENGQPLGFDTAKIFQEANANQQQIYFGAINQLQSPVDGAPRKDNDGIYTHSKFVFLQYAKQGETITINVRAEKVYARDTQVELYDPNGKLLKTIDIPYDNKPHPVTFTAAQTGIYRLMRTQPFSQRIDVDSSFPGNGFFIKNGGEYLPQSGGKLYFEVPAGVKNFTINMTTPSKDNFADIAIVDAQGKTVGQQKLSHEKPYKFSGERSDASQSEIWSIDISNANWGVDIKFGDTLMPVVSTNPATLLRKK
jgi:hypothetical protein